VLRRNRYWSSGGSAAIPTGRFRHGS